jgi:hypothetical protein
LIVPFHLCAEHLLKHLAIALSFDGFLCRAFGEPAMHFRINLPMWRLRPHRVRIVSGLFAGRSGLCAGVSREHIAVLLYMLGAQRQVRLRDDAVEPA